MTDPRCEVCEADLSVQDFEWRCACLECGGTHFCCVPCVAAWGRQVRSNEPGSPPPGRPGVWAEVDQCPVGIRATAEIMGLDLTMLSQLTREIVKGYQDQSGRDFGSGLSEHLRARLA